MNTADDNILSGSSFFNVHSKLSSKELLNQRMDDSRSRKKVNTKVGS